MISVDSIPSLFGANGEWLGISGRPEYVKEACEKSLKRLGIETIDLYYQHRPDPDVPVEESVGSMKRLVEEGKVSFIGLSEFSTEQIRAAHAVPGTRRIERLKENLGAWKVRFTAEELAEIRSRLPQETAGSRY